MSRDDHIFGEAVELPPAERAGYLDRACGGNRIVRSRVEALLAGHDAAAGFLETEGLARPSGIPEEGPGDTIDRYALVRQIGEGGCGVVYLATQTEPLRRDVALKVIKLGMDTRDVIRRFEGERQALAMMDHPDIARVFDAGCTKAGRPYFVMELVEGQPISGFCDEHRLELAARLELFIRVCLALQHAHQKGIVHRDLKPSNILVALRDGVPAPKVIDFGIAKAMQGRLGEQTIHTRMDQPIGTPAYMSPEQAGLGGLDVDTRSDVYSLGVLLHELLTGRPPFEPKALARAGLDEARRIVREVEPLLPSACVAASAAGARVTPAWRRPSALRGDLDGIVARCLEKDRARRYGTASELADDVRRHLRCEPVVARPPHPLYRLKKAIARHRLAWASAAAIAVSLAAGTVVSVRQAVRATRAEREVRAERDAATAASRAEALARDDAQRRQEQAEDLLAFMLEDFRAELKKLGRLDLLGKVGEKSMAYFSSLHPRDLSDTALARQAKALTQIGEIRMDEARYTEAADAFTSAYERAAVLAARHPRNGDMLFERAQAEYWIGFVARRRGNHAAAREWLTRYRDSAVALVDIEGRTFRAQREITSGHHNLAVLELEQDNLVAARTGFLAEKTAVQEMLSTKAGDTALRFRLVDVISWLGLTAECGGQFAEALAHYDEMGARIQEFAAKEPGVVRWIQRLAECHMFVGDIQGLQGNRAGGVAAVARARPLLEALVAQDPKNRQWALALLRIRLQEQELHMTAGDERAPVTVELDTTREQLTALVAAEPSSKTFARALAMAWRLESRRRHALGRVDADESMARAIELSESLIKDEGADRRTLGEFGQARLLAGRMAMDRARTSEARVHWQRVIDVLAARATKSNDWRLLDPVAQALVLLGQTAEARPLIDRLRQSGYRPLDSPAVSILRLATSSVSSPNPNR